MMIMMIIGCNDIFMYMLIYTHISPIIPRRQHEFNNTIFPCQLCSEPIRQRDLKQHNDIEVLLLSIFIHPSKHRYDPSIDRFTYLQFLSILSSYNYHIYISIYLFIDLIHLFYSIIY